jgi:hypothetical protein
MILYHYTTANGLQGIIKSKSIWASDCRFLNDATEFKHGLSIFKEIFLSYDPNPPLNPDVREIINRLANAPYCVFVASFCQHPDLLSQWRGYNGAIGYALGIDADWLTQNASEQDFSLAPACYDVETQKQAIFGKLKLLRELMNEAEGAKSRWDRAQEWWSHMLVVMACLKNSHFQEENEYRLIKATPNFGPKICTRTSGKGIIPYLPFELQAKGAKYPRSPQQNCGLECIVVGPGLHDEQGIAVDALLASQHMRFDIRKSKIPYIPN